MDQFIILKARAENGTSSLNSLFISESSDGFIPFNWRQVLMEKEDKSITASNIGCTPLFLKADPHKTGTKEPLIVPFLIHAFKVSTAGSLPSKISLP